LDDAYHALNSTLN